MLEFVNSRRRFWCCGASECVDGDFDAVFAGSVRSYVLRVYLTISL